MVHDLDVEDNEMVREKEDNYPIPAQSVLLYQSDALTTLTGALEQLEEHSERFIDQRR